MAFSIGTWDSRSNQIGIGNTFHFGTIILVDEIVKHFIESVEKFYDLIQLNLYYGNRRINGSISEGTSNGLRDLMIDANPTNELKKRDADSKVSITSSPDFNFSTTSLGSIL